MLQIRKPWFHTICFVSKSFLEGKRRRKFLNCLYYLNYIMHVRKQAIHPNFKQHYKRPAYIFPYLWFFITSQGEEILNKGVNVQHQSLSSTDDKLIDTCNSMRPRNKI